MHGELGGGLIPPAFETPVVQSDVESAQRRRLTTLRKLRQSAMDDYNAGIEIQRHARARYDALTVAIDAIEGES